MKWVLRFGVAAWAVCFSLICAAAFGLFLGTVAASCTALISDSDPLAVGYRVARYAGAVFTMITAPICIVGALRTVRIEGSVKLNNRPRRRFRI